MSEDTPRPPRSGVLRRLSLCARLLLAGGLACFVGGFVLFVERLERVGSWPPPHAGGIVALTGGAERVSGALDLLLNGDADRLLISGVNPSTSAGDLIRTNPKARALLDCCIELGYSAENTVGNARETRAWVQRYKLSSLIVVTSDYHMPRALAEIGDAAPGIELLPFPVVNDRAGGRWHAEARLRVMMVEYLKYLVVLARTHLSPAAPYGETAASLAPAHLPQGG